MPKTYPRPKLVIFDCDGVLIDSEPIVNAVLVQNLARHGLRLMPEQSQLTFTGLAMTELARMASQMGAVLP
jgi:beta-phosphoglucomutase-like phosphatase (HAD superfamily)